MSPYFADRVGQWLWIMWLFFWLCLCVCVCEVVFVLYFVLSGQRRTAGKLCKTRGAGGWVSEPDLCPACISINRNYYYLHQHGNTICSSSIRKYYYLHQYQEILLLTSAWKYLRQQQEEELLLQASPYSRNYYYLLQHRECVVLSFFSETTGWWQTKLFLPVGVSSYTSHSSSSYASLPTNIYTYITYTYTTYTHISHCPACLHHCSLVELDACLLAVWQLPGPETCTSSRFGFDRIRLDTLPATVHLCTCNTVSVCVPLCQKVWVGPPATLSCVCVFASTWLNKTPCLACHDGPDLAWKLKTLGATRHLVRSITVEVSAPRLLPSPGCTFPSCPTTSRPGAAERQTGLGHYASQHQTGPAQHFHLALFNGFLQRTNTRIGSK